MYHDVVWCYRASSSRREQWTAPRPPATWRWWCGCTSTARLAPPMLWTSPPRRDGWTSYRSAEKEIQVLFVSIHFRGYLKVAPVAYLIFVRVVVNHIHIYIYIYTYSWVYRVDKPCLLSPVFCRLSSSVIGWTPYLSAERCSFFHFIFVLCG